ncbi:hypothetical protein [Enterococcus casseliflavus]|uniref:hypothetical protein n=1 Tax=Enterococcus casseliflavus TaxID=37734 RepID=UPI001C48A648|nr:hypothetical protein [Enterococcus casseliflavus]MBV6376456.1 hypothetical protein [Enterococcus casseliflavus]
MKKLLKFEYLKFITTKKNWILSLFLVLLTLLNVYSSNQVSNNTVINLNNSLNEQINMLNSEKSRAEADLESEGIDSNTKESIETYVDNSKKSIERYEDQVSAISNNDFQKYWSIEKENLAAISGNSMLGESELLEITKQYMKLDYISSNEIIYEKNEMMPNKSWSFSPDFLSLQSSFISLIILIMILGDIVSKDFESNYRFLYTTLFKRKKKIIASKLIVGLSFFTGIFLVQSVLVYLLQGFLNGFGTSAYPVVLGNKLGALEIVSVLEFYFKFSLYYLVLLLFLSSLSCLLGLLIKKNTLVIGIMSVVYLAVYYLKDNPIIQNISKYNPITYMDVYAISRYSDSVLTKGSYLIGIVYLLSLSFIFILVSFRLSKDYY